MTSFVTIGEGSVTTEHTEQAEGGSEIDFINLGIASFAEVRLKQNELVQARKHSKISDTIIFCEHPPVITLGKYADINDLSFPEKIYLNKKIEIIKTDRGGGVTCHLPGQLMIYPVISLKEKKLGAKKFIAKMLERIADSICMADSLSKLEILSDGILLNNKKVVFCGLRIQNGITNHGFAVNVDCDVSLFNSFVPCRQKDLQVSSLEKEGGAFDQEKFKRSLSQVK